MKWAEFETWTIIADRWVGLGNVAVVPYLVQRAERGITRYLIARNRRDFLEACDQLGAKPSDLPRDRTSINIDGPFLMKAIVFCRRDAGTFVGTLEPWSSKCPTCDLPFDRVAAHEVGQVVSTTSAACADGHLAGMTTPRRSRHSNKCGGTARRGNWAMERMIRDGTIMRETSCSAKLGYSAGGAVNARRAMRRKRKNCGIYHCRFCGKYHLTSMV